MQKTYFHLLNHTLCITLMLLLFPVATMRALVAEPLPTDKCPTLSDGKIYIVSKDVTLHGNNSPAITLSEKATATIYIAKGVTLTVFGADGNGKTHAYAGIMVPGGSQLIITGEGTLIAQGGKAGEGGRGGNGGNGIIDKPSDTGTSGNGGNGGYGGGGAAPGIGGNGGDGHDIVTGPSGVRNTCETGQYDCDGRDGFNAQDGKDGMPMGTVTILGTVTVKAFSGMTLVSQASCGDPGDNFNDNQASGKHWGRYWTAGGGGAGGGGGSGFAAPYGIGGGGCGGQSGATGGSGGTFYKNTAGYYYLHGGCGAGGHGAVEGGKHAETYSAHDDRRGGYGGSAPASAAKTISNGTLYAASTTTVYSDGGRKPIDTQNSHSALGIAMTLDGNGGKVATGEKSSYVYGYYGIKPESVAVPTREGFFFLGYYTAKDGGTEIFDADGNAKAVSTFTADTPLYAQWSDTHIGSAAQFEQLCKKVAEKNMVTANATYYLEDNIDLTGKTCMLGTTSNPFQGTFDGQNHTITVGYNSTKDTTAVFGVVKQATIKNLNTTGTIQTSGAYAAGIVSWAHGLTMEHCTSTVHISSTKSGDGTHGGLVSVIRNNNYTINNCGYAGKFSGSNTHSWGGLVGYAGITGSISNSFVGDILDIENLPLSTACNVIARGDNSIVTNCFYRDAIGKKWKSIGGTEKTEADFMYGTVCYALNGNKTNGVWYQSVGEDNYPCFDVTHRKVFTDYSSDKGTSVCHNRNFIKLSTNTIFETGYTPNSKTQIYEICEVLGDNKSNDGSSIFSYTNEALSYLYNNGTVTVDSIPSGTSPIGNKDYSLGTYPLYVQSDCRLYEMAIMENGIVVHHFIPGIFNHMYGFYDTVENQFKAVDGADGYIDTKVIKCQHNYTIKEYSYGRVGTHCYICDEVLDPTYYVYAKFQSEDAIGEMNSQTLRDGDKLNKNEYRKQYGVFKGWKAYDRVGEQVGRELYTDCEEIAVSPEFCDTLIFQAQWDDAFTYNGDTLLINDENISNIAIKDDGTNGFGSARTFTAGNISYTRTIPNGSHWGSLCLPFAITEPEDGSVLLYSKGEIKTTNGVDSVLLTRSQVVEAGKPCMFYVVKANEAGEITFSAQNTPVVLKPADYTTDNLTFNGTFSGVSFKCDAEKYDYYGVQADHFYKVSSSYVVHPYHTYMTKAVASSAPAKYGISRWEDEFDLHREEPTGIHDVTDTLSSEDGQDKVYDLMGRKIKTPQRNNLYIINGKKYIVR